MTTPGVIKHLLIVAWMAVVVPVGAQTFDDIVGKIRPTPYLSRTGK